MRTIDQDTLRGVVEDVIARLGVIEGQAPSAPAPAASAPAQASAEKPCAKAPGVGGTYGVFKHVCQASEAAHQAFLQLKELGVEGRAKVIEIVKRVCLTNAEAWGRFELNETKIGRLDHKIEKLQIIDKVPGVEWLRPDAMSGDYGIMLEEYAPFGVIGAILPVTHSVPTLTGNVINMVAAGNAVVFNPHPGGAKSAAMAVRAYNQAIEKELGISHLICTIEEPTIETFDKICNNPHIALLAITGGPAVVEAAMKSGKRSICAGPGNPVVVVDETANLDKAAECIIAGAAYDNNLLCIGEKAVFVVDSVFEAFLQQMERAGAVRLNGAQLEKLGDVAFSTVDGGGGCAQKVLNRDLIGADAAVLAKHAGVTVPSKTELLFAEAPLEHPFVQKEQMMPMLPVVRVPDFETGVAQAKETEHGYRHSAIIHSTNVDRMTYMARALDTTIFIKNGSCVAGLGLGGEGYLSYSIATTTGEGITTPKTFTRTRRCVMVENLRIV
ncbi:aldehyde dehydrogenase family protein [Sulfuriroseicoccus oceanibius]|uniref:Aldehyde dehydrogenase EutE n=1 Tax=Sulfuriroseicoccus oceanibius TaxID=2707525 RepID=A0A6B3L450_9BACT|nr:aldehyde dehydrogenase family protein [Sulfuriroseicoccus oceanibius]QQL44565.1 aldehyde dehydrogenase EutE [Sulfuriroseicoccus oceanibius]